LRKRRGNGAALLSRQERRRVGRGAGCPISIQEKEKEKSLLEGGPLLLVFRRRSGRPEKNRKKRRKKSGLTVEFERGRENRAGVPLGGSLPVISLVWEEGGRGIGEEEPASLLDDVEGEGRKKFTSSRKTTLLHRFREKGNSERGAGLRPL